MEELTGHIKKIIFSNQSNGYAVLEMALDEDGRAVVLTGTLSDIARGQHICAAGVRVKHPSYGDQFKVSYYKLLSDDPCDNTRAFLASGLIKGVGDTLAGRIVEAFGEDTFRVMDEEPERLCEIKGISERMARNIAAQMAKRKAMRSAVIFLLELGMGLGTAVRLYELHGTDIMRLIREDPYSLTEETEGLGFKAVDELVRRNSLGTDPARRLKSYIVSLLTRGLGYGHTCLPKSLIFRTAVEEIDVSGDDIDQALWDLSVEKRIVCEPADEGNCVFLTDYYEMEALSARLLRDMCVEPRDISEIEALVDSVIAAQDGGGSRRGKHSPESRERQRAGGYSPDDAQHPGGYGSDDAQHPGGYGSDDAQHPGGYSPDDAQRRALITAASSSVCVITGGPGTGKTSIIKLLLEIFDRDGVDVLLAAPTGRAAKRMSLVTGYEAKTLHRLLEADFDELMCFGRNEDNPLETDAVIVDEMSMVDINLFYNLLRAMRPGMRLIMVGDEDQLPSVGPGAVLADIIASDMVDVVRLKNVFRQEYGSDIVNNAHRINSGEMIDLHADSEDFFFCEAGDVRGVMNELVNQVKKVIPAALGIDPRDIQVMAPMKKGELGILRLNEVLQELMNPHREEKGVVYGDVRFCPGDKVMQVRNDYKAKWRICDSRGSVLEEGKGVFNGDIGVVVEADPGTMTVTVTFDDGRTADYEDALLADLSLAYAITIHKSQGSEYPAVVLPLLSGPEVLMTRNLLYTAVTRAARRVVIIGRSNAVWAMIGRKNERERYTRLKERLQE